MCGIIGMISRRQGGFNFSDMEMYESMLLIDSLRGKDSTGAFTRFRNGDVRVVKHGSHPYNLFRTNEWKDFKSQVIQRGKLVIGHNRAATRGAVNTDNAHPFVSDNIILVHNGTLREQANLTAEKTEVDSHAIAHALAEKSYAEVLPKINGAFALAWYDTETDKLYATRNEERPLSLLISKEAFFIASESWMAGIPAGRNHIKIDEHVDISPGEVFVFDMDGKYTVEKVELNPKKDDEEERWNNYLGKQQWREHVHKVLGVDADGMEDCPPFDMGEETPETKALREKLAQQVLAGSQKTTPSTTALTTPSPSCALTQPSDTRKTPTDEELHEAKLNNIHSVHTSFPRGHTVLVKVTEITRMVNNRFRFNGLIYTPELERLDVQGFLPFQVQPSELGEWYERLAAAQVQYCTYTTNGGWTIHVRDVKAAIYTQVHGADIPIMLWDFGKNHCQCAECNRSVEAWEKVFTSIKQAAVVTKKEKPTNTVVMLCPDCIAKKIEKEDYRDRYLTKYRNTKVSIENARKRASEKTVATSANSPTPVQDREPERSEFITPNGTIVVIPSEKTIQ